MDFGLCLIRSVGLHFSLSNGGAVSSLLPGEFAFAGVTQCYDSILTLSDLKPFMLYP